jgi:uncharacterized protein (DUF1330 family)
MTKNNIGNIPWNKNKRYESFNLRGLMSGNRNPRWKGGRNIDSQGYITIYSPDHPSAMMRKKYVYEHRLVVEKFLGRFLNSEEQVHHVNGIKTDNSLFNLMVFNGAAAHTKFESNIFVDESDIVFDGRKI